MTLVVILCILVQLNLSIYSSKLKITICYITMCCSYFCTSKHASVQRNVKSYDFDVNCIIVVVCLVRFLKLVSEGSSVSNLLLYWVQLKANGVNPARFNGCSSERNGVTNGNTCELQVYQKHRK